MARIAVIALSIWAGMQIERARSGPRPAKRNTVMRLKRYTIMRPAKRVGNRFTIMRPVRQVADGQTAP
jgi:hypothetical protein